LEEEYSNYVGWVRPGNETAPRAGIVKTKKILNQLDWLILILIILAGMWLTASSINKAVHPAEDAAMLMRYAQHVSQGQGIVWNIGQPPVDGATDFLFMLVLAAFYSLGASLESTVIWVGAVSHLSTVLLVYFGIRRFFKGGIPVALLSAAFLLFGPGLRYAEAGFGTPFFALLCTSTWLAAQYAIEEPKSIWRGAIFSLSGLLMGFTRPEGVILAGLMVSGIIFKIGWKQSRRILWIFSGTFLILGGAYFLWRWQYFGYPLPNPYYKKGGGQLYFDSLKESADGARELSFPFWLVYACSALYLLWIGLGHYVLRANWYQRVRNQFLLFFSIENRTQFLMIFKLFGIILLVGFFIGLFRQSSSLHTNMFFGRYSAQYAGLLFALLVTGIFAIYSNLWMPVFKIDHINAQSSSSETTDPTIPQFVSDSIYIGIPIIGFILMWILLSNEMNYLWRFQYPILPVILMSWPLLGAGLWQSLHLQETKGTIIHSHSFGMLSIVFIGSAFICSQSNRWQVNYQSDGRFEVAQYLSQYKAKGYTIATTEAGLLPLYSGWLAVDTWGLNDQWIAHHGVITPEYLTQINPEIIMFHADFSPILPRTEAGDAWGRMVLALDTYARAKVYTLAAVYGESPVDTHYYYIRSDFPESQEITWFIQSLDNGKYIYGSHTIDYNKLTWKKDVNAK
jgi:hypothetical protein